MAFHSVQIASRETTALAAITRASAVCAAIA